MTCRALSRLKIRRRRKGPALRSFLALFPPMLKTVAADLLYAPRRALRLQSLPWANVPLDRQIFGILPSIKSKYLTLLTGIRQSDG